MEGSLGQAFQKEYMADAMQLPWPNSYLVSGANRFDFWKLIYSPPGVPDAVTRRKEFCSSLDKGCEGR